MTVRELILYIKEDAFETFIWFGEGSEKLWSFNFLDLTIGQMVFTLIIVGTSCKLALDELRNESESLFSERNKIAHAEGYFVHVFVKRDNMDEKVSIPKKIKEELLKI